MSAPPRRARRRRARPERTRTGARGEGRGRLDAWRGGDFVHHFGERVKASEMVVNCGGVRILRRDWRRGEVRMRGFIDFL